MKLELQQDETKQSKQEKSNTNNNNNINNNNNNSSMYLRVQPLPVSAAPPDPSARASLGCRPPCVGVRQGSPSRFAQSCLQRQKKNYRNEK
jgi:hypothetical protein